MGIYLNQGNDSFQSFVNSEIYIDKTELIAYTNMENPMYISLMKNYVSSLKDYVGDILMVGINYDKKSKVHQCRIEKVCK